MYQEQNFGVLNMKRYNAYKESGVEWIGEIPNHWRLSKNKFILNEQKDLVGENWKDCRLLSLTKEGIIYRDVDSGKGKYPASFENYKKIQEDDLVFCLFDIQETPRTVGLSSLRGMLTGAYDVFKCNADASPKFVFYYYLSIDDVKGLKPFYTGLRNVLRADTFGGLKINLPPLPEQQQIVTYLDRKTTLIDELIQKKEQKIALLKEKRVALINHAVTKGLNPDAEMKDSGVEWIGEIPKQWKRKKLKFLSLTISKGTTPSTVGREILEDGNIRFLKAENICENKVLPSPCFFIDEDTNQILKRSSLLEGDLLFVIAGATIGKIAILQKELTPANTNQAVSFIRLFPKENKKFVWYWLASAKIQEQIWIDAVQSAQPNLSMEDLGNFFIPYPNQFEQQQIVEYLDEQTLIIDTTIEMEQQKIELLKEYRQSLISEVVTGKIKVI